jgi:hypothetical protein
MVIEDFVRVKGTTTDRPYGRRGLDQFEAGL